MSCVNTLAYKLCCSVYSLARALFDALALLQATRFADSLSLRERIGELRQTVAERRAAQQAEARTEAAAKVSHFTHKTI